MTAANCGMRPIRGWLQKEKSTTSGAKRLLAAHNWRYFTLDVVGQLFYYGHNVRSKQVSLPIRLQDFVSVEPFDVTETARLEGSEMERSDTWSTTTTASSMSFKRSLGSRLRSALNKTPQHGFVLHYRRGSEERQLRLSCSSLAEATQWLEDLRWAMSTVSSHYAGEQEHDRAQESEEEASTIDGSDLWECESALECASALESEIEVETDDEGAACAAPKEESASSALESIIVKARRAA
eukprot:TRINITY_DN3922_c0_g3_i1.p1 TRINITY_DN3922_c0_g3~~TRINITY_DN3922_c0_g3_i1.p1  ORF type:complete len:239 (+),score=51.73 TRINITY_DN3922_c0_g3_i1:239-955(+)